MTYSWQHATLSQLYLIAFGDEPCTEVERHQARQEIQRRKKKQHGRTNNRKKEHYS